MTTHPIPGRKQEKTYDNDYSTPYKIVHCPLPVQLDCVDPSTDFIEVGELPIENTNTT